MSSPTQPTVLVVDDEADLRQLIAESLSADGFEVAQAPDAADAVERLKNFAYDALVVDLRLPDADGMEVLDAALSRYPDILAVMVTGFGGVTEAVSAMKRGAADFLIKPFQNRAAVARAEDGHGAAAPPPGERRAPGPAPRPLSLRLGGRPERRDAVGLPDPRARRADEQHRADSRRDRHRQGADRPDHPPQQPPLGSAVRRVQLRRHPGAAGRSRTVRPRQGRVHRRRRRPGRPLRAGPPRHAVHRRSRPDVAGAAVQAAARTAGARNRARRRVTADQVRRPRRGRDQLRSAQDGEGRDVPRGPLLPAQRDSDHAAAAARPRARTSRCWPATSC